MNSSTRIEQVPFDHSLQNTREICVTDSRSKKVGVKIKTIVLRVIAGFTIGAATGAATGAIMGAAIENISSTQETSKGAFRIIGLGASMGTLSGAILGSVVVGVTKVFTTDTGKAAAAGAVAGTIGGVFGAIIGGTLGNIEEIGRILGTVEARRIEGFPEVTTMSPDEFMRYYKCLSSDCCSELPKEFVARKAFTCSMKKN
jgi:hypothetical protein